MTISKEIAIEKVTEFLNQVCSTWNTLSERDGEIRFHDAYKQYYVFVDDTRVFDYYWGNFCSKEEVDDILTTQIKDYGLKYKCIRIFDVEKNKEVQPQFTYMEVKK